MNSIGRLIDEGFKNASITNLEGQQLKLGEKPFWVWKACQGSGEKRDLLDNFSSEFKIAKDDAKKELEIIFGILEKNKLVKE